MLEKTLGIVLHIIPYNDKISVAHLYTEQYGRSSYLIPQGGGKKARMFRSLFMPFSILELDIDYRNSRELQKIIEARTVLPLQNIYSDPVKNAEALFLSEVLCQTIKEPEPNLPLFAFIARSIQVLNIMEEGKANFHLCFLLQLCSFLGFSPNMETYRPGYFPPRAPFTPTHSMPAKPKFSPVSPVWISIIFATSNSIGERETPYSTES